MDFNSIIFPAPTDDKKGDLFYYRERVIFVPKKLKNNQDYHIPCFFQPSKKKPNSNKFMFYFHGNAEDIFNLSSNLDTLANSMPYNIVAMEYPGYSVYFHEKSSDVIEEDTLTVFDYFVKVLDVNPKDIIICGRSIGSGAACYLGSNRNPGAVILISPFTSIKNTVKNLLGFLNILVADRFPNIERINRVTCPILFIHGQKDSLIPYSHSVDLSKNCKSPFELILPEEMDHNNFDMIEDFIEPVSSFLNRHNLLVSNKDSKKVVMKEELYKIPEYITKSTQSDYVTKFLIKFFKT